MSLEVGCIAKAKQQRNVAMDNAIQRLPELVARISSLRTRIVDGDVPQQLNKEMSSPPRPLPSLREVLHDGPDFIHGQIEKGLSVVAEIEDTLF